jgi:hypothetical protein
MNRRSTAILGAANGGGARRLEHTKALEVTDIQTPGRNEAALARH